MKTRRIMLISGGADSMAAFNKLTLETDTSNPFKMLYVRFERSLMDIPQYSLVERLSTFDPSYPLFIIDNANQSVSDVLEVVHLAIKFFGTGNFIGEEADELELILGIRDNGEGAGLTDIRAATELIRQSYLTMGVNVLPTKITSPIEGMTKKEVIDLASKNGMLYWTCRSPLVAGDTYSPCGRCFACKEIVAAGETPPKVTAPPQSVLTKLSR